MSWTDGVAERLAALSLDAKGRPSVQLLVADAVRCGLLMDLAFACRLDLTDDSVTIDATPTGFPPADDLLASMRAEPERTLDEWFGDRRLGLHGFLDALVEAGEWDVSQTILGGHRYRAKDQTRRDRDKELDLTSSGVWTPTDAAVATLGSMAHLVGKFRRLGYVVPPPDIPDAVLSSSGGQEWMLRAGVDFLRRMRTQCRFSDAVLGSGGAPH